MTDKVQKIKEWISKTQDGLIDANGNFDNSSDEGAFHILTNLDYYIDSLQEEPVSEELEEAANNAVIALVPSFGQKYSDGSYVSSCRDCFKREELLELFKAGAKWQKEHLWKPADDEDLPEYEREVVVFTQNFPDDAGIMRIAIAHRPDPKGWDGKSITTGEVKHYAPQTYGKGGWNIPDVKIWLDVDISKLVED